jgi:hypothetical protein
VTDLLSKGYTVEQLQKVGFSEQSMIKGGVSEADYQEAEASIAAAAAASAGSGTSRGTIIVIAIVLVLLVAARCSFQPWMLLYFLIPNLLAGS